MAEQDPMDAIEEYVRAYNGAKLLEAKYTKAKKKLEGSKERLLAFMDNVGLDSVKRNGVTLSRSKRRWGKVTNFTDLVKWIENQDEPRSQFMEEVFIKGSPKDQRGLHIMLKDAQQLSIELGLPLTECLPPGLDMAVTDVVTVRQTKVAAEKKSPSTANEQLDDELGGDF